MRRSTELGAVRLKTVLALLIFAAGCYAGIKVSRPYYANSQLADRMRKEARFAQADERTAEQLRDIIYREAQDHDIPVRREDIRVEYSPSGVLITTDYTVTVDLHFYQLSLHFHPTSVR